MTKEDQIQWLVGEMHRAEQETAGELHHMGESSKTEKWVRVFQNQRLILLALIAVLGVQSPEG